MDFGEKLYKIRKNKRLSQEDIAKGIGVSRQTISNWELNISSPSIKELQKLANYLQININDLLNIKKHKSNSKKIAIIITFIFLITTFLIICGLIIYFNTFKADNIVGSNSITCNYNGSTYKINLSYNANKILEKANIEGSILNSEYITELGNYIFSSYGSPLKDIENYIFKYYEKIGGVCKLQ